MDKIEQAISWANKRLELQGKKLDNVQIELLTFALHNIASEISSSAVLKEVACECGYEGTYMKGELIMCQCCDRQKTASNLF